LDAPAFSLPRHNCSTHLQAELPGKLLHAPSSGWVVTATSRLSTTPTMAPMLSCCRGPTPSPSGPGCGTRWFPSAASRLAGKRTPHLAVCDAEVDGQTSQVYCTTLVQYSIRKNSVPVAKKTQLKNGKKLYSVFSKEHQIDTYKLVFGSVSTLLDNLLQPVRHTLHHVAQNLAVSHLEDPQPGDLLLQCLQVGGMGVLLQLHLYPAPSSSSILGKWLHTWWHPAG
jgi:hypothetical protein